MVDTCPYPGNTNPLYVNSYQFNIAKLPEVTYFVQETQIPPIDLGVARQTSSVHDLKMPGETMEYSDMSFSFIVDEELKNWNSIYFWMIGLGYPEGHDIYTKYLLDMKNQNDYSELSKGFSDGTLTLLDSSNNPKQIFTFVDMFPINLSGFNFESTGGDTQPAVATATFAYSYYKINKSPPQ